MKSIVVILILVLLTPALFADHETLLPELDSTDSYYLAIASATFVVGAINAFVAMSTVNQPQVNDFEVATTISATSLFLSFINFNLAFSDDNQRGNTWHLTFAHLNKKPHPEITLDLEKFSSGSK